MKRVQLPLEWYGTPTWPLSLFWDANMAAVTSCENTILSGVPYVHLCPEMHAMAKLAKNRQLLAI